MQILSRGVAFSDKTVMALLPPVPIAFVRFAHCDNQYWGLLRGQPPAVRIGGVSTNPSADCLRSLRSLWQSVLGAT